MVFCNTIDKTLFEKIFGNGSDIRLIKIGQKEFIKYLALHPVTFLNNKRKAKGLIANEARAYYINKYKPDIVHIEFSGLGIAYLPALSKLNAKKIVSCRGSAEKVKLLASENRKADTRKLFAEVNAIHCVSADMKETIIPYCRDTSKIFINFPSIDTDIFKRTAPYQQGKSVSILSIGRFTFQKGYFTGLQAIKILKEEFHNFTWTIIGDGPGLEEIIFHIHQMGLQQHVVLAGPKGREEVITAYNNASVFFLPSVYEGIANVVLEAMSMELPVVATKSGGLEEVISHGENGMLAAVYDAPTLAANILQLITNEEKSKKMGTEARKRILQQFTIEKQADIFELVYQSLIKN